MCGGGGGGGWGFDGISVGFRRHLAAIFLDSPWKSLCMIHSHGQGPIAVDSRSNKARSFDVPKAKQYFGTSRRGHQERQAAGGPKP